MDRIRARADFLAAQGAARVAMPAFLIQARARGDDGGVRVGFTVTRKVGNAVERNRIRRRLRAAIAAVEPSFLQRGHDYVMVARRAALARDFALIEQDLRAGLDRLNRPARSAPSSPRRPDAGSPRTSARQTPS